MLNEMSEFKELKSNPHRDFYNVRKVSVKRIKGMTLFLVGVPAALLFLGEVQMICMKWCVHTTQLNYIILRILTFFYLGTLQEN